MSCFVRIATRMTDLGFLRRAMEDLGHPVRAGAKAVRGWNEGRATAEVVFGTATPYDIGAVRAAKDGPYELVADWGMARLDQAAFVREVTRRYSYLRVTEQARRAGFQVAREEVAEDGSVRLLLRKFA